MRKGTEPNPTAQQSKANYIVDKRDHSKAENKEDEEGHGTSTVKNARDLYRGRFYFDFF